MLVAVFMTGKYLRGRHPKPTCRQKKWLQETEAAQHCMEQALSGRTLIFYPVWKILTYATRGRTFLFQPPLG